MPLPNIHLNKGKYPLYGKDPLKVVSMGAICHISQFYASKPKQYIYSMLWGYEQLYHIQKGSVGEKHCTRDHVLSTPWHTILAGPIGITLANVANS